MGQKVNPHGARVGVIKDWSTRWYADKKNFADNLVSDAKLRKMIKELEFVDDKSKKPVKLYDAGISSIDIERRFDNDKVRVTVTLNVAKPGIVIGANGANIEKIKAAIVKELGAQNAQVILNVQEIKNPDLDAQLVAENIAAQLENRVLLHFGAVDYHASRALCALARRASRPAWPAVWAARISRAARATTRVLSRCRPCVPTLTTALPRRRPLMAAWA